LEKILPKASLQQFGRVVLPPGGGRGAPETGRRRPRAKLKALVRSGKLRYVLIVGGPIQVPGRNRAAQSISDWVTEHGKPVPGVGDGNLYDLTGAAG